MALEVVGAAFLLPGVERADLEHAHRQRRQVGRRRRVQCVDRGGTDLLALRVDLAVLVDQVERVSELELELAVQVVGLVDEARRGDREVDRARRTRRSRRTVGVRVGRDLAADEVATGRGARERAAVAGRLHVAAVDAPAGAVAHLALDAHVAQFNRERVRRGRHGYQAVGLVVVPAQALVLAAEARELVLPGAVEFAVAVIAAQAQLALDERTAERGLVVEATVGARGHFSVAVELVGRLVEHVVDRAGKGVLAVERALRTLDHFDARDVGEADVDRVVALDVDAVDEGRDVLHLGGHVDLRQAAHHGRRGEARREILEREAGRGRRDVLEFTGAAPAEFFRRVSGDDHRDVLDGLFALARRDDDFLQRKGLRHDFTGQRGREARGGTDERCAQTRRLDPGHEYSP